MMKRNKKSGSGKAELTVLKQLHFITSFLMLFVMPPFTYYKWGLEGLVWSGGILFLSWAYWIDLFTTDYRIDFRKFYKALKVVCKTDGIKISMLVVFCVYNLFTSFVNTVLPHVLMIEGILVWLLIFFICILVFRVKSKPLVSLGYIFFVPLAAIMAILCVNSLYASDRQIETYFFNREVQSVTHHGVSTTQESTLIHLENNEYGEAVGIRIFPLKDDMNGSMIEYEFATGLFGLKYVSNYTFRYNH
jgi:hypothetical protein